MDIPDQLKSKARLIQAWNAGVESVSGKRVTAGALQADGVKVITYLLAVGKAAAAMCLGALSCLSADARVLVVTKYGHVDEEIAADGRCRVIESGHPVPDDNSLQAGVAMQEFVASVPADAELVMLVSGGASALAESLPKGMDLEQLQTLTSTLLADGYDITRMNAVRMAFSGIKGGKLLAGFPGASVRVYAISDVPGDDIATIGSGIGSRISDCGTPPELPVELQNLISQYQRPAPPREPVYGYKLRIIGSNRIAREGAAAWLRERGLNIVSNREALHQDVFSAAAELSAELLTGPPGAYVWGGEPTIVLPPKPGCGGRNQSLALAIGREIRGRKGITVLVAGTDGTDGPTAAAGGLVDGDSFNAASGAEKALTDADAGTYLARIAALFKPGPTGTNVMDLALAIKL